MAYASNTYGGGIRLPSIDYTLTKPLDVLGSVAAGLEVGNMVSDIPNTARARKIVTKQQNLVLDDKMVPTEIGIGAGGGLSSKLQDPLTYELARSLDSAKAQTEKLQGDNFQSQIDRRNALTPGEMEVLNQKALQLNTMGELNNAKSQSILSPEVSETITPSGDTIQVVTGPSGAKEVGKSVGGAGAALPEGAIVGDKVLDQAGTETGYVWGNKGPVPDRSNIVAAQAQKMEADKPKTRPTSKYEPFVSSAKLEQELQKKWVVEDPFQKAEDNLATIEVLTDLAPRIISGGPGGVLGKIGDMYNSPEQSTFLSKAKEMAQNAKLAGVGAQSDADMILLAMQVPGSDKPLEANQAILTLHKVKNERAKDYSTTVSELINSGFGVNQAKTIWKEYANANPLYTQKDGNIVVNPAPEFNGWFAAQKDAEGAAARTGTVAQAKAAGLNLKPGTYKIKGSTYTITE